MPTAEDDVTRRWEQVRQRWLSPKPAQAVDVANGPRQEEQNDGDSRSLTKAAPWPRRSRDAAVASKLQALERLLRTGSPSGHERGRQGAQTTQSGAQAATAAAATPSRVAADDQRHGDAHTMVVDGSTQSSTMINSHRIPNMSATASNQPPPSSSTSSDKAMLHHKPREPSLDELQDNIDGEGLVIRKRQRDELKRASESILLAFKQARPLKEPLPLSLVVSLLYRSWELDGTIPRGYVSPPLEPPMNDSIASRSLPLVAPVATRPSHAASSSTTTMTGGSGSLNPALPPRSIESTPTPGGGTPVPPPEVASTPPPASPSPPDEPVDVPEPRLQGLGGTGENGKVKVDMLRGSRWRTEKEVLSGSDVI
ncbi:hypothetical protein ACM66B_002630 [Microbotryomycetes sp. NB124-2]